MTRKVEKKPEPRPAPGIRTEAERKSAEAEVQVLVAEYAPAHSRLVAAVRKHLAKRLPAAHEIVYEYRDCFVISYSANDRGYEGALAIRAGAKGVALYFNQGKDLPDLAKLLKGAGKQVRSIDLEDASMLARPELARLIDEAVARSPEPYDAAGAGSIVIRATTARKHRLAGT